MPEPGVPRGTILAFDFGQRRIGVAAGQFTTMTASSLETVANGNEPNWDAIDRLVKEWKPSGLLIGLPLGAEGEETDMSRAARRFGNRLHGRYGLPVHYQDERMSSLAAQERFIELRSRGGARKKHAGRLDAMAAQIILENWLHGQAGKQSLSGRSVEN
jgi:putative Holliday junction resolvase